METTKSKWNIFINRKIGGKKMIKTTEQNIKQIYGILKKFFMSKNNGYITWHNFDCGKRKINPYKNLTQTYNKLPINFELDTNRIDNKILIRINPIKGKGFIFKVGDEIELKSGIIKHKQKWNASSDKNYIYRIFQSQKIIL